MKPCIIYKKDSSIYDLVKNDIPIPEEYQNMDFGDLIDGITENEIPIVYLFCLETDFTLYWPGKEPRFFHYNNKDWAGFVTTLQSKGKQAKDEGLPVMVWCLWNENNSVSTHCHCRWCGSQTERPKGKTIPFCSEDCKKKYKKFQNLLRKLVKEGIITEFEQTCRLKPYISIIGDTRHKSYNLIQGLWNEYYYYDESGECIKISDEDLPDINTNFYVTEDQDIIYVLGKCPMCDNLYYGKSHSDFCSDKCRYNFNNMTNKEYNFLPLDLIGVIADIPEMDFRDFPIKLKNVLAGFNPEIYKDFRKKELRK